MSFWQTIVLDISFSFEKKQYYIRKLYGLRTIIFLSLPLPYRHTALSFYMNILFIARVSYNPQIGGIEKVAFLLAKEFIRRNAKVFLLNESIFDDIAEEQRIPSAHYYNTLKSIKDNVDNNAQIIADIVSKNHIDILINYNPNQKLIRETVDKALQIAPTSLVNFFNIDPLFYKSKCEIIKNPLLRTIKWAKYKRKHYALQHDIYLSALNNNKAVLLSNTAKNEALKYIKDKSVADNIRVIYNSNYPPMDEQDIDKKENIILFVGRIASIKQPLDAIKIWEASKLTDYGWKFIVLGDGKLLHKMKAYVSKKRIRNIDFLEFQPPKKYMDRAKAILSTSKTESYSLVTFEAMARGVVPFTYEYTASRELFTDRKEAVIIPRDYKKAAKILKNTLLDNATIKEMSLNAIKLSKQRTIEKIGDQWWKLFQELSNK